MPPNFFFFMKNICISSKYTYLPKQGYSPNLEGLCPRFCLFVCFLFKDTRTHIHKKTIQPKNPKLQNQPTKPQKVLKVLFISIFFLSYLFLFSEFHFHLFVTRLVLANAMSSYKIATDVSQFWILLACFFYQPRSITCVFRSFTSQKMEENLLFARLTLKEKWMHDNSMSSIFKTTSSSENHCKDNKSGLHTHAA